MLLGPLVRLRRDVHLLGHAAKTIAPRAIKNVRSLRIVVSMTSGPERPDADKGEMAI